MKDSEICKARLTAFSLGRGFVVLETPLSIFYEHS